MYTLYTLYIQAMLATTTQHLTRTSNWMSNHLNQNLLVMERGRHMQVVKPYFHGPGDGFKMNYCNGSINNLYYYNYRSDIKLCKQEHITITIYLGWCPPMTNE